MLYLNEILGLILDHYCLFLTSIIVIKLSYSFYQSVQQFDKSYMSYKPSYGPSREKYFKHQLAQMPTIYPYGWSPLLESRDLKKSQVLSVNLYDEDLVVYRDGSGEVHVFDAYCPHLGAHIGIGGTVESSDRLRCPFHGWLFNTDGKCVAVPGLENDNLPKASLKKWVSAESGRMIWIWRHPDGREPKWPCITMPNVDESELTYLGRYEFNVMMAVQDYGENTFDFHHFGVLHTNIESLPNYPLTKGLAIGLLRRLVRIDWNFDTCRLTPTEFETPLLVGHLAEGTIHIMNVPLKMKSEILVKITNPYSLFYRYLAPGTNLVFHHILLPSPDGSIKIVEHYYSPDDSLTNRFTASVALPFFFYLLIQQDTPIWQNRRYKINPVLSKLDWGITIWRRWMNQFTDKSKNIGSIMNKVE